MPFLPDLIPAERVFFRGVVNRGRVCPSVDPDCLERSALVAGFDDGGRDHEDA